MKEYTINEERNGFPVLPKSDRKKILLLSDDIMLPSGVGHMSKEIVLNTCHYFNWVQIGGAIHNPNAGKILDLSSSTEKLTGVPGASVVVYPVSGGYGNSMILREVIQKEKPDLILHFTDPRFWLWLYMMENEIRQEIPIAYYNIWDDVPAPYYNQLFYGSCDLIMNISKQTKALVELVNSLNHFVPEEKITYVPHGVDSEIFYPFEDNEGTDIKLGNLRTKLFDDKEIDFVVLYNNRNIRRKMPGDVMQAFKTFVDKLPPEKAKKCALVLHTQIRDEGGTDLEALRNHLFPGLNIVIDETKYESVDLNILYNLADVTINIASNEGFGLSSLESIMSGTMIINNVTGGLQDQLRFEDKDGKWIEFDSTFLTNHIAKYIKHGPWGIAVFPKTRSLVGSIPTPYIMDDRVDWENVADAINYVYSIPPEKRAKRGILGREWALGNESMMTAGNMGKGMISNIIKLLATWRPKPRFTLTDATAYVKAKIEKSGIQKWEFTGTKEEFNKNECF